MDPRHAVELQHEVHAPREAVWPLVSTADGLARWLDDAQLEPSVGGSVRLALRDAVAIGTVLAVDPPQHVSFSFDWDGDPIGTPTVVAFDAIEHGEGTHLTMRHVGLPAGRQHELHAALWHYWFPRLVAAASAASAPGRDTRASGGRRRDGAAPPAVR